MQLAGVQRLGGRRRTWGLIFGFSLAAAAWLSGGVGSLRAQEASAEVSSGATTPAEVARELDVLIERERAAAGLEPGARAEDLRWARRLYFDLLGRGPTAEEIAEIDQWSGAGDRQQLIQALVEDERFAVRWSRYWRDVIFYRRSEERSPLVAPVTEQYLQEAILERKSWAQVADEFITAQGDGREDGRNGLIIAQGGRPEETVSEISRIFLGIQIQCAQCHDHPSDSWTREQFHELAAFFPRVSSRFNPQERTISVVALDQFPRRQFGNGMNRFVGTAEHRMPDLEDPQAPGEVMRPVFFVDGTRLELGTPDAERREKLAERITSPANEWFAKAAVNRLWAELIGRPFYEAIDDIGPERTPKSKEVLERLAQGFVDSGHDFTWLVQTIVSTELYGRESREWGSDEPAVWLSPYRMPLSSDQLFDRLVGAIGISDNVEGPRRRNQGARPGGRNAFTDLFGFDPSDPRDQWSESIPQALLLMNGEQLDRALRSDTGLAARLVRSTSDPDEQLERLYLATLHRRPEAAEQSKLRRYLRGAGERRQGLEDVHWALINSSEFLHRD